MSNACILVECIFEIMGGFVSLTMDQKNDIGKKVIFTFEELLYEPGLNLLGQSVLEKLDNNYPLQAPSRAQTDCHTPKHTKQI
jgi:hypothetical protein